MRACLFVVLLSTALSSGAAGCAAETESPVGLSAAWLTPRGTIPEEVQQIEIIQVLSPTQKVILNATTTPNLMDADGNGRREIQVNRLPTGMAFELEVQAKGSGSTRPLYIGRSGELRLETGERRYIDIAMYPVIETSGAPTTLDRSELPPRAIHTATAMPDGRVLIAGGFITSGSTVCPPEVSGTATCFAMSATSDAYVFDPPTTRFFPVTGGILAARGGHTATALPDGRVLIAGGAPSAVLAVVQVGPFMNSRELFFLPTDPHSSFEVFDPERNAELEDADADGDAGRGGFVGDAGTVDPGPLNAARFMHAPAANPATPTQVILAGGTEEPDTYEVFDIDKPGGFGVYAPPTATLSIARTLPGAVSVGGTTRPRVWIAGGGPVTSNAELIDVWEPDPTDPNGTITAATDLPGSMFPTDPHPEWALMRPSLAMMDDAYGIVTGWYGPRCPPDMGGATPVFSGGATEICNQMGGPTRTFTFDNDSALAVATATPDSNRHAFGSAVQLRDGRVVIAGGASNELLRPNLITVVYSDVSEDGRARGISGPSIADGRLFGAAAPIFDTGFIVTGGFEIENDASRIRLIEPNRAAVLSFPERMAIRPGA